MEKKQNYDFKSNYVKINLLHSNTLCLHSSTLFFIFQVL